ncbi:hypothetical protein ABT001_18390 [Streptomyces sp. NPDC002793]|uniref:hypothetical protein n=1 Tax=Streptomyces sp. NPDC002793 TaxID=3154432 RepID=UPI003322FDFC
MLAESLIALAAAGGTAVVQAAGTEMWESVRDGVVQLCRRGPGRPEEAEPDGELERRLDQTARVIASDGSESDGEAQFWRDNFLGLLSSAEDGARQRAEAELTRLVESVREAQARPGTTVHGNTYDRSPQQIGDGNHMQIHYGPDA